MEDWGSVLYTHTHTRLIGAKTQHIHTHTVQTHMYANMHRQIHTHMPVQTHAHSSLQAPGEPDPEEASA